jgi:hypothetical protein
MAGIEKQGAPISSQSRQLGNDLVGDDLRRGLDH